MANLERFLIATRRRVRLVGVMRLALLSFYIGCMAATGWRIAFLVAGKPESAAAWPAVLAAPVILTAAWSFFVRIPLKFAALSADRMLNLDERLVTWLQFRKTPSAGCSFFKLLVNQLERRLSTPGSPMAGPGFVPILKFPPEIAWAPLPLALLLIAMVWPYRRSAHEMPVNFAGPFLAEAAQAGQKKRPIAGEGERAVRAKSNMLLSLRPRLLPGTDKITGVKPVAGKVPGKTAEQKRDAGDGGGGEKATASEAGTGSSGAKPKETGTGTEPTGGAGRAGGEGSGTESALRYSEALTIPRLKALDRAFRGQVERYPEVALALVRYRKKVLAGR